MVARDLFQTRNNYRGLGIGSAGPPPLDRHPLFRPPLFRAHALGQMRQVDAPEDVEGLGEWILP